MWETDDVGLLLNKFGNIYREDENRFFRKDSILPVKSDYQTRFSFK